MRSFTGIRLFIAYDLATQNCGLPNTPSQGRQSGCVISMFFDPTKRLLQTTSAIRPPGNDSFIGLPAFATPTLLLRSSCKLETNPHRSFLAASYNASYRECPGDRLLHAPRLQGAGALPIQPKGIIG